MKKVYRYEDNEEYWNRRWQEAGHDRPFFEDLSIYPIRYAEMVMADPRRTAVEIGCGLGRLVKHYHNRGFAISGLERSEVAVNRLKTDCAELDVSQGDVMALPYANERFDVVLAFGLYHNLENGLEQALAQTARVLKNGGKFAVSMRPNNLEMNLNEVYWRWRARKYKSRSKRFHKLLVGEREFASLLSEHRLITDSVFRARNVSLWYRVPFLRSREIAQAGEDVRRSSGYRLNLIGRGLDWITRSLFPYQTANVIVFVGHKAAQ